MSNLFSSNQIRTILDTTSIGSVDCFVSKVVIDSREADGDSLFVPLVGEFTDGNLYIEGALKLGCRLSLVLLSYYNNNIELFHRFSVDYDAQFFVVDDGLMALHRLAKWHIERFENLTIIGITGSSGKTSTKEILFRITKEHRYAVLEMGMSSPGEIKALVDIANPHIGIITNIGTAHIGFFNNQEGIAREKRNLFSNFSKNDIAIIPEWDDYSSFLSQGVNGDIIIVPDAPEYITEIKSLGLDGWSFLYKGFEVLFPYVGEYNLKNAYLSISCARELNVSSEDIVKGLTCVSPIFGRGEILKGVNRIVRDCYNANPDSMRSSLRMLSTMDWDGDKLPILGSMLELGEQTSVEHLAVVNYALELFPRVIFYGSEFKEACKGFEDSNRYLFFTEMNVMKKTLVHEIRPGTLVLLKASRGVKLEGITESIL
ncbi:MAG: hypothetical protein B6229_02580 [Spirochaetaceae bacterium 4572_7]|nr:MAG: hypothetical protein B6229_02580 [Spirochaetaceae bacterium 4572_7]